MGKKRKLSPIGRFEVSNLASYLVALIVATTQKDSHLGRRKGIKKGDRVQVPFLLSPSPILCSERLARVGEKRKGPALFLPPFFSLQNQP